MEKYLKAPYMMGMQTIFFNMALNRLYHDKGIMKSMMTEKKTQMAMPKEQINAAERALAEAAERQNANNVQDKSKPKEFGGREGPDPIRYGDWENKGLASDF